MKIRDLMTKQVATVRATDSTAVAARLMWDCDCGAVPVLDGDGRAIAMITDRDICMAAYTQGRPIDQILVNAVMATHVVSARPEQALGDVEHLMAEHQVRRVPVVDGDDRPLGVLSLNDLAIESVEPDTRMVHGFSRVTHALAAVCRRRTAHDAAA